jgi:hypothetical protein
MPLLVYIGRVERLFFFKVIKSSAFVLCFDIRNIRSFLELELLPNDALEEGMSLNFINSISAQSIISITQKSL